MSLYISKVPTIVSLSQMLEVRSAPAREFDHMTLVPRYVALLFAVAHACAAARNAKRAKRASKWRTCGT